MSAYDVWDATFQQHAPQRLESLRKFDGICYRASVLCAITRRAG